MANKNLIRVIREFLHHQAVINIFIEMSVLIPLVFIITLLHSEWQKLQIVLTILIAEGTPDICSVYFVCTGFTHIVFQNFVFKVLKIGIHFKLFQRCHVGSNYFKLFDDPICVIP